LSPFVLPLSGQENRIRFPAVHGRLRVPQRLRVRTVQALVAIPLKLASLATVEKLVVPPVIAEEEREGTDNHGAAPS
jgi:hypothetical protein